jgi:DNA-binding NarL/FixJ family response regulator
MDRLRLLIADDHPVFRHRIRAHLGATLDVEVVGEAMVGDEAIALAETLQPDVSLMDIQMPGANGIEATRRFFTPARTSAS